MRKQGAAKGGITVIPCVGVAGEMETDARAGKGGPKPVLPGLATQFMAIWAIKKLNRARLHELESRIVLEILVYARHAVRRGAAVEENQVEIHGFQALALDLGKIP